MDEYTKVTESLANVVKVVVLRNHRVMMVLGIQRDIDNLTKRIIFVSTFSNDQVAYRRNKGGEILREDLPNLPV